MKKISKKYLSYIIGAVILTIALIILIDASLIPPGGKTITNMLQIGKYTAVYIQKYGYLPDKIDDIFENGDVNSLIEDGWGNKMMYSKIDDSNFLLTSYGKDNKRGGIKQNSDIIREMEPVYDSNGLIIFFRPIHFKQ